MEGADLHAHDRGWAGDSRYTNRLGGDTEYADCADVSTVDEAAGEGEIDACDSSNGVFAGSFCAADCGQNSGGGWSGVAAIWNTTGTAGRFLRI